ncbi:unknown protein [Rivularia sp. IAM M-261]|nr:unknown protein [Rivularia sp. IAM M-261]
MKSLKLGFVILASTSMLFLGACSGGTQESAESNKTETAKTENVAKTETGKSEKGDGHDHKDGEHSDSHKNSEHSHGGQVVESGAYHLELVTEKEDKGTHMHFHLEKGEKHEPVTNAKVTAQVQLPDGTQKNVDFKYDEKEKEYTALLPGNATGQYQMKVTANVGSEKVEGRFTVKQ